MTGRTDLRLTEVQLPKDHIDLVNGQKLAGLFCKERPIRGRVHDDRFQFAAQNAALLVLLGRSA